MPKKEPSFNKEYLSEKLLAIKEKLGDAYGSTDGRINNQNGKNCSSFRF